MDKTKILKMFALIGAIILFAAVVTRLARGNSMSLSDYANLQGSQAEPSPFSSPNNSPSHDDKGSVADSYANTSEPDPSPSPDLQNDEKSSLPGASLNGDSMLEERRTLAESFYCEPLSENLRRYITGVSYPSFKEGDESPAITPDKLRYIHILHYNFDGEPEEGELICNELIAWDLLEIFYELYRNEYQLEHVLLIDTYDGDDEASMEADNTSCFNYRTVDDTDKLSKHALGLAVDINPLYNPYITYDNGVRKISPEGAEAYSDRSDDFPYKIDEDDLCYKLFIKHGFTWGGNWNSSKDYQHFQKTFN